MKRPVGRPKEDTEWVRTRMIRGKRQRLADAVIALGYSYSRDGETLPAWGDFLEAIADGDLILHKKVEITP